jgi:hypothetical protein
MKLDHSYCTVLSGVIVREGGRSSNHRRLWVLDAPHFEPVKKLVSTSRALLPVILLPWNGEVIR